MVPRETGKLQRRESGAGVSVVVERELQVEWENFCSHVVAVVPARAARNGRCAPCQAGTPVKQQRAAQVKPRKQFKPRKRFKPQVKSSHHSGKSSCMPHLHWSGLHGLHRLPRPGQTNVLPDGRAMQAVPPVTLPLSRGLSCAVVLLSGCGRCGCGCGCGCGVAQAMPLIWLA